MLRDFWSEQSLKRIIKVFFAFSMFLMFAGLFAEIAFVASNKPVGYVNASVAIAVLGFTLLPAGGAVEWFLPWDGRYARLTRGLTLFGTGVAILATIYRVYAIFPIRVVPLETIS